MSRPIVIESLSLQGFGPYLEEVRVDFPGGLGIFVGPNEQGKSTLVAGIAAVLFGLPTTSDPEAFGVGRYRNWDDPTRFTGEMTLDAGGVRFRIRRNFDNHRVSLSRLTSSGWIEEIVGEHNPSARRPNPAYTEWLISLFHHASRELFQSTFCVVQPLPHAKQLSAELQSLLAGAGGGGHETALERLVQAAKLITKETGARGLTPRDGRKLGKLDELAAEIASLEIEIQASRQVVQGVQETAEEIAQLTDDMGKRRDRLATVRKSLGAFETWRRHAHRVKSLSDEVGTLSRTKEGYLNQERELEAAAERQGRLYPELIAAPPDFGDGLALVDELFGRVGELNRTIEEADRLSRELERVRESRKEREIPVPPGETAVSWVRQIARDLEEASRSWDHFVTTRRRFEEIHETLATRYAPFEEAAPSTLAVIESYDEQRARLLEARERARRDLERAEAARLEADRARQRLEERFPRATRLCGDAESLHALVELSQRSEEAKGRLERLEADWKRSAKLRWAGVALGVMIAVAGHIGGIALAWALGSLLALASLGAAGLPGVRRQKNEIEAALGELRQLQVERDSLARELGDLGRLSAPELVEVREEIRRFEEAAELVRPLEAQAPDHEEIRRLKEAVDDVEDRLSALDDALASTEEAFDDFQEAFATWRRLRQSEEETRHELERTLASWGLVGVDPRNVENELCPGDQGGLTSAWERLMEALSKLRPERLSSGEVRFGEFVEVILAMQDELPSLIDRAQAQDDFDQEIADLEKTRRLLVGSDGRGGIRAHLDWIENHCNRLAEAFGEDWQDVWEKVREAAEIRRLTVSMDELLACLPSTFREALAAADQDLGQARRRWQEFKRLGESVRGLRQRMESTLRAFECQDVRELENRLIIAQTGLTAELAAMEKLAAEHPSLPPPRSDGVYDDVDERFAGLQAEAKQLEDELREIERRLTELTLRQAELHGGAPINIAQAELRLEALNEQAERLRFELEAVSMAHRELSEAATEYYDSHLGRLQERAGEYFSTVSKHTGRRVYLDDELKVMAVQGDGKRLVPAQLSQGARDQLYLSLRLAIGDLLSAGQNAPFILDDPFHNCDEERLDAIRQALVELSHDRQILLFTHRRDFADWGDAIVLSPGGDKGRGA